MFGPGAYRPDPTEGITVPANLPQPEIVPYSRNDKRHACPHCGHQAYRDKQLQRTLLGGGVIWPRGSPQRVRREGKGDGHGLP